MATFIAGLLTKPVGASVEAQTDDKHKGASNQCSWCAHQFCLHGLALIKHFEAGNAAQYVRLHNACVTNGTALRQAQLKGGAKALSWGENLDDKAVLAHSQRISALVQSAGTASSDQPSPPQPSPHEAILRAVQPGPDADCNGVEFNDPCITVLHEELARDMLATLASIDPALASQYYNLDRHPRQEVDVLQAAIASLPPAGFILLERYGLTLAILRTNASSVDDCAAYCVTDSHCHEAGGMSLANALAYALMDVHGGGEFAAITWVTGRCLLQG